MRQKTPRWLLLAGVLVLAGAVLVGLVHKPTQAQRAADLNAVLAGLTADVQSCAGGVGESLTALHGLGSSTSRSSDTRDTIKIARDGAANCSPANNELLGDLTQYQVTESLAAFHLERAVSDLIDWCFPYAQRVQNDVANMLGTHDPVKRQQDAAALRRDIRDMNAERATIYRILRHAVLATGATGHLPRLPG